LGKGVITTSRKKYINANIIWNPTRDALNALDFNEAGSSGITKVGVSCKIATPPVLRGVGNESILVSLFFTEDTMRTRE
jgi:hypothetical protein